ncbi:MAG: GNAT family N-acetyltransferase [Desulfurococcaceae archaeon]
MNNTSKYTIKHTSQVIYATLPGGKKAYLKYTVENNVMKLIQTYTPEEYRGKGIASQLVDYAINLAQANNWLIEPICSYTVYYFMKNKERRIVLAEKYRNLSEEDWQKLLEEALRKERKGE